MSMGLPESPTSGDSQFAAPTKEQLAQFREFLKDKKILVTDLSQSVRSNLCSALTDLGASTSQLLLASTFEEAREHIRTNAPHIVLSDYNLDQRLGLELVSIHREVRPELDQRLFVLVTGNSTESTVAEAAEEDVDAFVLKPFTANSIRHYLLKAFLAKAVPTAYRAELSKGRLLLAASKYEDAVGAFSAAMELDPAPSLACYYLGQSYEKLDKPLLTEQSYQNGLIFNEIHYKCSAALFDFFSANNRPKEAYEVIKKISKHFPLSPQKLSKTIELAVRTQNFGDIAHYYGLFSNLKERRDELRKCVSAALVVGAMFQIRREQPELALKLLQNAAITAAGSPAILREIVLILVQSKLAEPADAFLKRFPADTHGGADYRVASLARLNMTANADIVVAEGRKLRKDGIQDPLVHEILIQREKECGHADMAEQLFTEALSIWPDQAEKFSEAFGQ